MILNYIRQELSNINFHNLWNDKIFLSCILIGFAIVYVAFNIITSTIKYPIIITGGLILGKLIYNYKEIKKNS